MVVAHEYKLRATLGEISTFVTKGATPTTYGFMWEASGVTFLRSECVSERGLDLRQSMCISQAADQALRRSRVSDGDLLITITGNVGRVIRLSGIGRANINQHIARVRVKDSRFDPEFVYYFLSQPSIREYFETIVTGQAYPQISLKQVRDTEVLAPDLDVQREIASSLSVADAVISTLARLITKKQAIKQGLMQQLLTSRTRLPGFREAWMGRRVSEMGEVLAGKALNISGTGASRPYLRTKNVLDGQIDLDDVLRMPMTEAEFERFCLERGDVLLNEGQSLELVGRCSLYNGEFGAPCAMQNQLLRFRAYSWTSPAFAAHLFRYCQKAGVFAAIATQTTSVAHLGASRFGNLRLLWPTDHHEQVAIAEVLSATDVELAVLDARLEKAKAVKQGMMQELLTGRTRLTVPEEAA